MAATRTRHIGVRFTSNLLMGDVMKHVTRVWLHVDVTLDRDLPGRNEMVPPGQWDGSLDNRKPSLFRFRPFQLPKPTPVGCDRKSESNSS